MFCLGGFCPGGFWQGFCPGVFVRGLCPGGFCLGGFCPRTALSIELNRSMARVIAFELFSSMARTLGL